MGERMTTHLHADGLAIDDSPICQMYEIDTEENQITPHWQAVAFKLERNKRRAEAQLAVAVEVLKIAVREGYYLAGYAKTALAEINAIETAGRTSKTRGGGE